MKVCKWLRAYRADKFVPGERYDPDWTVETDEPMSRQECFDTLLSYCCQEGACRHAPQAWAALTRRQPHRAARLLTHLSVRVPQTDRRLVARAGRCWARSCSS